MLLEGPGYRAVEDLRLPVIDRVGVLTKLRENRRKNRREELRLDLRTIRGREAERRRVKALAHLGNQVRKSVVAVARCNHGSRVDDPCAVNLHRVHLAMEVIRVAAWQGPERVAERLQGLVKDVRPAEEPPRANLLVQLDRDLLRVVAHVIGAGEVKASCGTGHLRQRVVRGDVPANRAQPARRDFVARERRPVDA